MNSPRVWSSEELQKECREATEIFRKARLEEPLEAYLEAFDEYQGIVEDLLESTVDLTQLGDNALDVLTNDNLIEAFRYLPGPPISADDLKVLAEAKSLSPNRLRSDADLIRRIVRVVLVGLDRRRFVWVSENRDPTEAERDAAILASAALMATQRVGTIRRSSGKKFQEQRVEDALLRNQFIKVTSRRISTLADAPSLGQFCGESMLGTRKGDFIVRLWDQRVMPIECKVSNSSTNSVKRLNNDAAVKAVSWRKDFGETQVVPSAVLSGVYKLHNLQDAQSRGLAIFWAHDLDALIDFIESTRRPPD
jgi:hypothetical protein